MKLYKNCRIITMNEDNPIAEVLVEEFGKIFYVGKYENCPSEYKEKAEIVDLKYKTVLPSFWESHMHLIDGMRSLLELNLRECKDFKEFENKLKKYSSKMKNADWIIGHGWDESKLFNGVFPNKKIIDNICSEKAVVLIRMDGHSLCLNSKGIELLELNKLPESSEISYDNKGELTGMFFEGTANIILSKIIRELPDKYIAELVLKAQDLLISNGISSINDICTNYGRYFDIYRKLYKEGKLKIRITASPFGMCEESVEEFDTKTGEETDKLKIGPSKYFIDGSFGSRTALLFEAYNDCPDNYGLQIIKEEALKAIIMDNEVLNKPINIHAIGDKAVNIILNCIEESRLDNQRDIRSRIEHIQIVKDEDIERFKALDITASFQPVFLYEKELTLSRLGEKRLKNVYRFKSFINNGVNVIFNSDWPYGGGAMPLKPDGSRYIGFEPLLGIHAACCMQMNAKEVVTPIEAIRCYTINPSKANYREKESGKLKKGYFADFIVLDKDITDCEAEEILSTRVLATIINGELVYEKNK